MTKVIEKGNYKVKVVEVEKSKDIEFYNKLEENDKNCKKLKKKYIMIWKLQYDIKKFIIKFLYRMNLYFHLKMILKHLFIKSKENAKMNL